MGTREFRGRRNCRTRGSSQRRSSAPRKRTRPAHQPGETRARNRQKIFFPRNCPTTLDLMKVLYVTTYDSSDVNQWSGLGYYIRKAIEAQGFDVHPFHVAGE